MSKMCSNVKCDYIKSVKGEFCPECGSETVELEGFKNETRWIKAKKGYQNEPIKYGGYTPNPYKHIEKKTEAQLEAETEKRNQRFDNITKTCMYIFGVIGALIGFVMGFILGALIGLVIGGFVGLCIGLILAFVFSIGSGIKSKV